MKRYAFKPIIAIITLLVMATSCKEDKKKTNETENEPAKETVNANKITLEKLQGSPTYAEAVLELNKPATETISNGDEVDFTFTVNNYELGAQTQGPNNELLANSAKGQHIHFILNNQPYSAHYEAEFKKEIPDGTHHLVAFLSRSYHESVKNDNSVVVKKLQVGDETTQELDMDAPTLIYSRPKGEYSGEDTENLLLDFFVLNTQLAENGNKVRATINEEEFIITQWAPHVVKGLPMGEVTIKLELIDDAGNLIPGPFNTVTRTVMLKK